VSRRWLSATLIISGFLAFAAHGLADISMAYYLKMPEVHNYKLTEAKLQAFDRVERRIFSVKPNDPLVKAMNQHPRQNASLDELVRSMEDTPIKPLVESNGLTVREWFIWQIVLRGAQAAASYYEKTHQPPTGVVSQDTLAFYVTHEEEINKMRREWSELMAKQNQAANPPAPKKN